MDKLINPSKEYITSAAIWYKDGLIHPHQDVYRIDNGFVIAGVSHPVIISTLPTNPRFNGGIYDSEQGFITSFGRFVGREEAKKIAVQQNQIVDHDRDSYKILFSEDIVNYGDWIRCRKKLKEKFAGIEYKFERIETTISRNILIETKRETD